MAKRNIAVQGREEHKKRPVTLLSSGAKVKVDPSRWVQVRGVKEFDETTTSYLRVYAHKQDGTHLIHGMRSELGGDTRQAYDIVTSQENVDSMIVKVAEHCGISDLVAKL